MRTATAVLGFAIAVASVNVGSRRSTPMGVRPRQLLEQENPGDSCVVRSLMFLQWLIWFPAYTFNTTSQGTFGDFGIGATDTVSGENFECYVKDIEFSPAEGEGWHDCNIPSTQFRFTIEPLAVEIRKNWTCDDAPGLAFSAQGDVKLGNPDGCQDFKDGENGSVTQCLMVNTQIYPNISSPIHLEPFLEWQPWLVFLFPPDCMGRAETPLWTIEDFHYVHEADTQSLSLNIVNFQNGGEISCTIPLNETKTRAASHNETWYDCDINNDVVSKQKIFRTQVMYDKDYGVLGLQQDYQCPFQKSESGVEAEKNFTGLAYLVQKPNCTKDIPYYGGLTGDDADYSCSLAVFNMSGYAEQDFPPIIPHTKYTRTCTGNSLVTKSMTLTTFITNDDGSVTIRLLNPSPNDEYGFQLDAVKRDGKWHTCESSKGLPWQLESCEYLLEAGGSDVGFKLEWFCDDLDPYHAYLFTATVEGNLVGDKEAAELKIMDLSWEQTNSPMQRGPPLPWV